MRKFSKGFLILAAACAGLTSCSDESPWGGSDSEGGIRLDLSTDGRVMRQTRADEAVSPMVPDGDSFAISLTKSDGSYSKNWSSVEGFNRESAFPIGDYDVVATYGDVNVEGFELPAYRGVTQVHVSPGAVSDAHITATLANAMVTIKYTDDFKANFSAYSASIQTEGHDYVVFAQNEDRPAYISPSEVKLNLTLTNAAGESVTIRPAGFTANARHHYAVTIGVTDDSVTGDLALDVVFDEDVVAETVEVPLGDELWTAPAPTVTAKGFTTDALSMIEGGTPANALEFHVFAFGGLHAATLNVVTSSSYAPAFGRSVELVNADDLVQSQLKAEGVDCAGFFRNVDKMGVVNVTKFVENLPAGDYKVQLQVVDALTRTSEPTELSVNVTPVTIEASAPAKADFLSTEVTVDVTTNCEAVKEKVSFKAPDENNRMVEVPVKSVTEVTAPAGKATRAAGESHTYRYVLDVAAVSGSEVDVQVIYGKKVQEVKVPVDVPEFDMAVDAFARYIVVKVNPKNASQLAEIVGGLEFFNGSNRILASNITRDSSTGLITIAGFTPGVTYTSVKAFLGKIEKTLPAFTTEAATDVPNGEFSLTSQTINISSIDTGGKFRVSPRDYQLKSSIVRSEANGWASVNELTASRGSSNMNTWFVVPSTFAENGEVIVRSVGYSHNGTSPSTSGGSFNTKYYCENAPSDSQLEKAAGELFLGSYPYTDNGTGVRTDGIRHASRPASMSFSYRYTPVGNEQAEAYVVLLDASGAEIAGKTVRLAAASSNTNVTVALPSYPFGKKAASIRVGFRSTASGTVPVVNIPSGNSLKESPGGNLLAGLSAIAVNAYKAVATGSQLWLDNVKLNYDAPAAAARRKARK